MAASVAFGGEVLNFGVSPHWWYAKISLAGLIS